MLSAHKVTKKIKTSFQKGLYQWSYDHPRSMPWKGEKDPYKIWLSEIILQQTRVDQGLAYYHRFTKAFPTILHLAKAPLQKVLKLWEGLGYYTRARNLHHTAQHVAKRLHGTFPDSFEEIKSLKGIGEYTAAAIASFAYRLPFAVLDGNVHRIISRYLGVSRAIQTSRDKKYVQSLADLLLDEHHPDLYNQAIMDFGAMCCTPKLPQCSICPLHQSCYAWNQQKVESLPPPKKSIQKKTRNFHYFILKDDHDHIIIQKRKQGDVWADLFEFPLIESDTLEFPSPTRLKEIFPYKIKAQKANLILSQTLSHQIIRASIYIYKINTFHKSQIHVPIKNLNQYPMPGILAKNRKSIFQMLKTM